MDLWFLDTERNQLLFYFSPHHVVRNLVGTKGLYFSALFEQSGIEIAYPGRPYLSLFKQDLSASMVSSTGVPGSGQWIW